MRETTIARNYAEALLVLARRANDLDGWGAIFNGVADSIRNDARLRNFLAAPQVTAAEKNAVIEKALAGSVPRTLMRYLQKLVSNRRQLLIPEIAVEYGNLVDESEGRVHAQVTVAREATETERAAIASHLSKAVGKRVVPHLAVNPAILGGVVVRIGDRVMDGSVRRRLATLRGRLGTTR
jgi:F-type H+-transporting ATPase subunit delta